MQFFFNIDTIGSGVSYRPYNPSVLGATALVEARLAPQLAFTSDGPGLTFSAHNSREISDLMTTV